MNVLRVTVPAVVLLAVTGWTYAQPVINETRDAIFKAREDAVNVDLREALQMLKDRHYTLFAADFLSEQQFLQSSRAFLDPSPESEQLRELETQLAAALKATPVFNRTRTLVQLDYVLTPVRVVPPKKPEVETTLPQNPDGPVSGFGAELSSSLMTAVGHLEAGRIERFLLGMFPLAGVAGLQKDDQLARLKFRLTSHPEMVRSMIDDLRLAATADADIREMNGRKVATVTLAGRASETSPRTIRFELVDGNWRFYDSLFGERTSQRELMKAPLSGYTVPGTRITMILKWEVDSWKMLVPPRVVPIEPEQIDREQIEPEQPEPVRVEREELDAGVSPQQKRIDDFMQQTAKYQTFDELIDGLSDPLADDILQVVSMASSDLSPQRQFAVVMADRRVARAYTMLERMPKAEASVRVEDIFETKLRNLKQCWNRSIELCDSSDEQLVGPLEGGFFDLGSMTPAEVKKLENLVAERNRKAEFIPISEEYRALSSSLFLCSVFGDPQKVLNAIDRWELEMGQIWSQIEGQRYLTPLKHQAIHECLPEQLFLVNLYTLMLTQRGCHSIDDLKALLGPTFPRFVNKNFCAWGEIPKGFDFTQPHRGELIRKQKVVARFHFAPSWRVIEQNRRDHLVSDLRELVQQCFN